jgi:hypothetical protein
MRHRRLMINRESDNEEVLRCQDVSVEGGGGLQRGQEEGRHGEKSSGGGWTSLVMPGQFGASGDLSPAQREFRTPKALKGSER